MSDQEQRLRQAEALALLTNRLLIDYLSLQVAEGKALLSGVKELIAFSATEVIRGAPAYETEVRDFERLLQSKFDQTFAEDA